MSERLNNDIEVEKSMGSTKQISIGNRNTVARGIVLGVVGGLMGMIVMDLVMVVEFLIMRLPVFTYLELIGSVFGGGVPLGVVIHVLLSIILGLLFIILVFNIGFFRISTISRGLLIGVVFGVATIIGCVPFAIITGIPVPEILSFSSLPHIVFGVVCGLFVGIVTKSKEEIENG